MEKKRKKQVRKKVPAILVHYFERLRGLFCAKQLIWVRRGITAPPPSDSVLE
jgi:hypothetical protein